MIRAGVLWVAAGAAAQAGDGKDRPGTVQAPPSGYVIPDAPALSPQEALRTFVVEHGFRIELAAAEPMVVAPVCMAFDGDGRLWVVEMRSYMPDVDGKGETNPDGAVAILTDGDGDGRFERRVTFLDGLVLPRAVCPLRGGALVIEPPHLWWCPDRDGDGKADGKAEVAAGLGGIDSPEHAPNGLLWALDNRIYLAKHDVCYVRDGDRFVAEPSPALGQWGIAQDDLGRLFHDDNSTQLRVDLLPRQLAIGNPRLGRARGLDHVAVKDQSVWPVRVTPGVNRGYQPGTLTDGRLARFTAACSPWVYRGDLFPETHRGNAFVCEPSANLIKRNVLRDEDGIVNGAPATRGSEFLASHDERFRPVALAEGPDGALYVADMYRGVLQHRLFVTTFLRRQILERKLEAPLDLGRIWRVVPAGAPTRQPMHVSRASGNALVDLLGSASGVARDAAQRELVQRGDLAAVPALHARAQEGQDLARLHALWTLEGLGALERGPLLAAIFARSGALRAAGYELARARLCRAPDPILTGALLRAVGTEADPRAQRLAVFALGATADADALGAAVALVVRVRDDELLGSALVAGFAARELALLQQGLSAWTEGGKTAREACRAAAIAICRGRDAAELSTLLVLLAAADRSAWQRAALLDGIDAAVRKDAKRQVVPGSLRLAGAVPETLAGGAGEESTRLAARYAALRPAFAAAPAATNLRALTADEQARFARGQALFVICAGCHGPAGAGTAEGPPLVASEWLAGPVGRPMRILLHGLEGPLEVDGTTWDKAMPPVALGDAELAAVLTFARRTFGEGADPVTADEIAAVRAQPRDRPWTAAELETIQ